MFRQLRNSLIYSYRVGCSQLVSHCRDILVSGYWSTLLHAQGHKAVSRQIPDQTLKLMVSNVRSMSLSTNTWLYRIFYFGIINILPRHFSTARLRFLSIGLLFVVALCLNQAPVLPSPGYFFDYCETQTSAENNAMSAWLLRAEQEITTLENKVTQSGTISTLANRLSEAGHS